MSNMNFSERQGLVPVSIEIQTAGMNDALRNSLWNVLDILLWESDQLRYRDSKKVSKVCTNLRILYFKTPIDELPISDFDKYLSIREYFFDCAWNKIYDFIEALLVITKDPVIPKWINGVLEQELAGYRFVDGTCTPITDQQEIEMLEEALADQDFPGVKAHLKTALDLLSKRDDPDFRNSIKESISAVESIAQIMTDNPNATLGKALNELIRMEVLHPTIGKAYSQLYGYTSSEDGIRHAMMEEPTLSVNDAKFFLLSCTSFINYLKTKI